MAVIALLVLLAAQGFAVPMPFSDTDNGLLPENYLQLDGQLPGVKEKQGWDGASQSKMKEMQGLLKLKVTGNLDNDVSEMLKKRPRCGVSDTNLRRSYRWPNNIITYRIENYTPDLRRFNVDRAISAAFGVWAGVTPLTFRRVYYGTADIMISFRSGAHGDNNPFDGPSNTLAHAFYPGPGIGGDIHFDEDEHWTLGSSGINLYIVAAHEIGHALGLDHSLDPNALMYKSYIYKSGYPLNQGDIMSIQALYGRNRF